MVETFIEDLIGELESIKESEGNIVVEIRKSTFGHPNTNVDMELVEDDGEKYVELF